MIGLIALFIGAVFGGFLVIAFVTWIAGKFGSYDRYENISGRVFAGFLVVTCLRVFGGVGDGMPLAYWLVGLVADLAAALLVWKFLNMRAKKHSDAETFE